MKLNKLILTFLFFCILVLNGHAQEKPKKISVFRDSTDNAYDISDWLIHKKQGFLLMPDIDNGTGCRIWCCSSSSCFSLLIYRKKWSSFDDRYNRGRYTERYMDGRFISYRILEA